MKTQLKSNSLSKGRKKGSKGQVDGKHPHTASGTVAAPLVHYPLMMKAIQKVAQPVSFNALKKFYNLPV